jgi:hypothetical protein
LRNGAVGGIRTRDLRSEIPESWTARRRQRDREDQNAKWLLEQGSNLQALRHLINSQARLPNSAIQDQKWATVAMRIVRPRVSVAQRKRNAAQRIAPQNFDCVAPWRAHQNVVVAPDLNTTYAVMPGPGRTGTASDVGSAGTGAAR